MADHELFLEVVLCGRLLPEVLLDNLLPHTLDKMNSLGSPYT